MSDFTVAIVGGGLVGSLSAVYFAKRGYRVKVYEKRPDIRKETHVSGRSINLALSVRGLAALEGAGVSKTIAEILIPMRGRMVHDSKGTLSSQEYGSFGESINSVDRKLVNQELLNAAEKYPNSVVTKIKRSSVDHRQEPSSHTTFSIYGLAAVSITYLRSILAPILGHQMEHVSKIDRRTTKHGARFRITVPEDRQRNIIQRLERQSKQTHWRIQQNYRHRRPDQPRPTAPPPPLSRQILAVNVANISNKRPAIRHIVRNTRLWAISETCITSLKFCFTVLEFD
ncbi:hypothetical protein BASA81_011861, partial [Batrachochytrium salamandrivorans]